MRFKTYAKRQFRYKIMINKIKKEEMWVPYFLHKLKYS